MDWSLDHYVGSFFVSCNHLYFKVCFIWYKCYYFSCLFIYMEYTFEFTHFQSVCVSRSAVNLLYPQPFCLLVEAFNPFTFKVIIEMYILVILFIVLELFLWSFFSFFFCSLKIWWLSSVLQLNSFYFVCVCIYYRCLVYATMKLYGSLCVCVCVCVYKLLSSSFQAHFKNTALVLASPHYYYFSYHILHVIVFCVS